MVKWLLCHPSTKELVFDVNNSLTKHHSVCMGAIKNLHKVRFASYTLDVAFIIWNPILLGKLVTGALEAVFVGLLTRAFDQDGVQPWSELLVIDNVVTGTF